MMNGRSVGRAQKKEKIVKIWYKGDYSLKIETIMHVITLILFEIK